MKIGLLGYGRMGKAIEKIAQLFNHEYKLNVSCLKLGNIYGPRERWLEAGDSNMDCPFNYQKVVPSFFMDTLFGCLLYTSDAADE